MISDRYAKDYKLQESVDQEGHVSFAYGYEGPAYRGEQDKRISGRVTLYAAAGWIFYVAAMLPFSFAMHTLPIALSFVFTAIPLWMLARVAVLLGRVRRHAGTVLHRKEADLLTNTYPPSALFTFLLPAICLTGEAVRALTGREMVPGDALFCVFAVLLCVTGILSFRLRRQVQQLRQLPADAASPEKQKQ